MEGNVAKGRGVFKMICYRMIDGVGRMWRECSDCKNMTCKGQETREGFKCRACYKKGEFLR